MTWFDQEDFERARVRAGAPWGRPVRVLERTPSTNDLALEALSTDAKSGIVWLAREQTEGRGRRGTAWYSEPGESLLFSTLLRFQGSAAELYGVSLAVGLGIRDAIADVVAKHSPVRPEAPRAELKWPNDVLLGGRKVAGVLVETRSAAQEVGLVIGVGLNVHQESFPEGLGEATSLRQADVSEQGRRFEELLALCLKTLSARISPFLTRGLSSCLSDVSAFDALRNVPLSVTDAVGNLITPDGHPSSAPGPLALTGVGAGIDPQGRLMVAQPLGTFHVTSGHVRALSK